MIILDNYARKLHDHYCGFEKKIRFSYMRTLDLKVGT